MPKNWKPNEDQETELISLTRIKMAYDRDSTDLTIGILVFIDVGLFFALIFLPISEEYRRWLIAATLYFTIAGSYSYISKHYKKYPIKDYFEADGFVVTMYNFTIFRKILFVVTPLIIILLAFYLTDNFLKLNFLSSFFPKIYGIGTDTLILLFLVFLLHIAFPATLPSFISNEFNLCCAMGYIEMSKENTGISKAQYLIFAVHWYNKYIRKILRVQINDIDKIYSRVISDSSLDIDHEVRAIARTLKNQNNSSFNFETVRYLNLLSKEEPDEFLSKETTTQRIKDLSGFIIPIVTIVLTIIGFVIKGK